ncbi:MAG: nitroreductase family protein [Candidatus Cryptobacteroides sp.]
MNGINIIMMAASSAIALATMTGDDLAAQNAKTTTEENVRTLPAPAKSSEMTLMEALQLRHSEKEFQADKPVTDEVLADLLWAACGINRPESKKLTAPSAINAQDIVIYVCTSDGAWLYEADKNQLRKVSGKDLRSAVAGRQQDMADAPLFLLLVSDQSRFGDLGDGAAVCGAVDAGYVSQNICLACTALGLATRPRMSMDKEVLVKELNLNENQILLINHPVGYPKGTR